MKFNAFKHLILKPFQQQIRKTKIDAKQKHDP